MAQGTQRRFGWKLHGDGRRVAPDAVVDPEERLAWPQTVGIGMQHVIAMFGATFLVPVLTGFPVTTTIFFSGVGTLVFLALTRGRGLMMGLPSYTGSSFAFIAPVIAAKGADGAIAPALGGIIAAGLVLFVVGLLVDRLGAGFINWLMPPAVTGAIVVIIGLALAPVAWAPAEGSGWRAQPWTAFVTLAAIVLFTVLLRGFLGRISILLGVIVGYLVAWPQDQLASLSTSWEEAAWFALPEFTAPTFDWRAITLIVPVVVVLVAENAGHVKAVASMTGRNLDASLGRSFMGDGAATMIAGAGGGSGTTTYAENIGVMAATRVYSTAAYVVAGLTAIGLGMIPKFGAVIGSIPAGVLGGAAVVLFGLIAVLGGRIWVEGRVEFRDPVNLFPAGIGIIMAVAGFSWTSDGGAGSVTFDGIAIGTFATIVIYHVMRFAARHGIYRGGHPYTPASVEGDVADPDDDAGASAVPPQPDTAAKATRRP